MWSRKVLTRHAANGVISPLSDSDLADVENTESVELGLVSKAPPRKKKPQVWVMEEKDFAWEPEDPICEEKDLRLKKVLKHWFPPVITDDICLRGTPVPLQVPEDDEEIAAAAFCEIQYHEIIQVGGTVSTHGGMSWDLAEDRPPTPAQDRQTPSRLLRSISGRDNNDSAMEEQERLRILLDRKEREAERRRKEIIARRRLDLGAQNREIRERTEHVQQKRKEYIEEKRKEMIRREDNVETNRDLITGKMMVKVAQYNKRVMEQGSKVQNDRFFNQLLEEEGITVPAIPPPERNLEGNLNKKPAAGYDTARCLAQDSSKMEELDAFASKPKVGDAASGEKPLKKKNKYAACEEEGPKTSTSKNCNEIEDPKGGTSKKSKKSKKSEVKSGKSKRGKKNKVSPGCESETENSSATKANAKAPRRSFWSKLKALFCVGKPLVEE